LREIRRWADVRLSGPTPKKSGYSPFSIASIAAAARFAEPIASITVAAPVAMSPPA